MTDQNVAAEVFNEKVAVKYHLYNSLFLTLPYEDLEDIHTRLPLFANYCADELANGVSPVEVVQNFLSRHTESLEEANHSLFRILQIVERQVVLFDALEDAAFTDINDMNGPGSLTHLLNKIEDRNVASELANFLEDYSIRIVLTAHPTQFYPNAVLGIINDLSAAIAKSDVGEIRKLLVQLSRTKFKNPQKPTPHQEALSIIWYLKSCFYKTMPEIQKRLENSVQKELPPLIEMGFWPAGDRDGNPFVTHNTTFKVARELKVSLIRLYLEDMREMRRRLTFDGVYVRINDIIRRLTLTLEGCFQDQPDENRYVSIDAFLADLYEVRKVINERHMGLFVETINDFIRKVRVFGFHFATMDIRQDSSMHSVTMEEITNYLQATGTSLLKDGQNYSELLVEEKIEVLNKIMAKDLNIQWDGVNLPTEISIETIRSLQVTKKIQALNGERGVHRYIISNTQNAAHLFEVMTLAHLSGWKVEDLTIDVTPLFETIEDLFNAEGVMEWLYSNPFYKKHLAKRGNKQYIMLGFSDGTKDGGYLAANWNIYLAKRTLTSVSRKYGIHVTFFDGRGGPPARGGGNTHRFYRSLGENISHNRIHLTIQGQTISSNFGTVESNQFNLEQMLTAGIESHVLPSDKADLCPEDEALIVAMSDQALKKYISFKEHPLFTDYLSEMTPLKYYNRLNVGSRPAKRKKQDKLKLSDLRAIPFVGSWSQIKQNVPGFYGLGTAIQGALENGKEADLKRLYQKNLFFKTLLDNAIQSLTKTYFPLTKYLAQDERYGEFWQNIYEEAVLTEKLLLQVTEQKELMEDIPHILRSVKLREKIILPLLTVQQYSLDKIRLAEEAEKENEQTEVLRKMVVKSLAANINASRNSA